MRYWLSALALLSSPVLAQSGQLTLSPVSATADNGQQTAELLITYRPASGAYGLAADYVLNLDRLGWAEAQVVQPQAPGYVTYCQVAGGSVRVLVLAATTLPAGVSIPLCRMRVRPHAHTPRGYYSITPVNVDASDYYGNSQPTITNSTRIYVP
jgi:hypothetical protein